MYDISNARADEVFIAAFVANGIRMHVELQGALADTRPHTSDLSASPC